MFSPRFHRALLILLVILIRFAAAADEPVTIEDDGRDFILANGVVNARISKQTGNLESLKFRELDLLKGGRGYWSFAGSETRMSGTPSAAISIDPATNDGARAEVAVDFPYDERRGGLPCDVSIRYALGGSAPDELRRPRRRSRSVSDGSFGRSASRIDPPRSVGTATISGIGVSI